jgi:hypothetical protein
MGETCSLYGQKRNTHAVFVVKREKHTRCLWGKEKYTRDVCGEKRNTYVVRDIYGEDLRKEITRKT